MDTTTVYSNNLKVLGLRCPSVPWYPKETEKWEEGSVIPRRQRACISERSKCSFFNQKLMVLMTSIKIKFLQRKKQQDVLYDQDFLFEKSISQICEMPKYWKKIIRKYN